MATVTSKAMYRGAAPTSNTTLYTVPAGTKAIVTNIIATNTHTSSITFSVWLNGTAIISGATLAASSIATFDIKQVLDAGLTISAGASSALLNFHISGVEVA